MLKKTPYLSLHSRRVESAGRKKAADRRLKQRIRVRSDGDEVYYRLKHKLTLPVARCWSDWSGQSV